MLKELDLELPDGRSLHAYDTGECDSDGRLPILWHHGTPNLGAPPKPLFPAADRLGIRWVSYDRPGYGGSTAHPGRDIASAATCASTIADALGIEQFAVMGHSGGGPHALACAALLPVRVLGVVSMASLAPFGADGLDWFAGMAASGVESLHAAAEGRAAKETYEASGAEYDPEFTLADEAALSGEWSWLHEVVGPALKARPRRVDRRRPCLRRPVGFRARGDNRSGPLAAWPSRSGRSLLAQRVAGAPLPLGRAVAVARRWARLCPQLRHRGDGVAPRPRRIMG